ncbi:MAG: MepB family protein, partial [Carnobacterium sp.]|uniref:MepB family protein n=1 Tax=Carnobacterium sp. TaxID=48221 RepID=UPI003C75E9B3
FKNENVFGQFIFPKDLLLRKGILSSKSTKGKMAIRVYPSWDVPSNRQGVKTQEWQLPYFIDMSEYNEKIKEKLVELYSL